LPGDVLLDGDVGVTSPIAGATLGVGKAGVVSNSLAPAAGEGDDRNGATAIWL
jgi:hypothetical protein